MPPTEPFTNTTEGPPSPQKTKRVPNKLVLCFDGTGNTFSGSNADTNVVKLLNKLDRNAPGQYHYYQTGIGTYEVGETSVNKSWWGRFTSSISQTVDQGLGMTFDAHVMAGYRFLMRYYEAGDAIYMFGFSRGAFTAKFLARMIHTVGLLCKGNEEMVPFAFRLYQRYLAGETDELAVTNAKDGDACLHDGPYKPALHGADISEEHMREHYRRRRNEVNAFKTTFCRKDLDDNEGQERDLKVFFLGIWDCVNSVAVLENNTPHPVAVKGTAHYVRHAVSVDERRVKFKPALLAQDIRASHNVDEDIREVWFPGQHGDVGGGWPATDDDFLDEVHPKSTWQHIKEFFTTRKAREASNDPGHDAFQMSDVSLAWMIDQLEHISIEHPEAAVKWTKRKEGFKRRFRLRKDQALRSALHDTLRFGRGVSFFNVLFWKFMEYLPSITRWELEENKWVNVRFPLNKGNARDIPPDAVLHSSLIWRLHNDPTYHPRNNHGGRLPPCLKQAEWIAKFEPLTEYEEHTPEVEADHQTFRFANVS